MPQLFGKQYTKREVEARVSRINQIGGISLSKLDEGRGSGVRQALFRTGAGLEGTIFIDRAMDLGNVQFKGAPLGFMTSAGEVHPAYYIWEGSGWERGWAGGLLTTCGLENIGPPREDAGEQTVQHGRISHLPAEKVSVEEKWNGDEYICTIRGEVHQTALLKEHLILHRSISFVLGEKKVTVNDVVENRGFKKEPHMLLYHINLGFPLLSEDTQLITTPKEVNAWSEMAQQDPQGFEKFDAPQKDYVDRQYRLDFLPDESGIITLGVLNPAINDGIGLTVKYKKEQLPDFNLWKMIGEHNYVVGIEPMNSPFFHDGQFVGRPDLREKGILKFLEPGEQREYNLEFEILEGKDELNAFRKSME